MKVMVMVKASPGSEAGKMPSEELMAAMGNFNEALVKAGVMESGDGLKPSCEGYRVRFNGADRAVIKGPFAETNELIAGYWIWEVSSMEEALEWAKKCPNPMEDEVSDLELRPFFTMEDYAEWDSTGEFVEQEKLLRNEVSMQKAEANNYLFFAGRCEEALDFYKQHLGAKIGACFKFSESPDPLPEGLLQPGFEDKIMHCDFTLCNTKFLASDGCNDASPFSGFSLSIGHPDADEVTRIFNALAEGGEIVMPLGKTFFSPHYGQVKDKFGMQWMVLVPGE